MAAFRDFEIQAIRILADGVLTDRQLSALEQVAAPSRYEYTGSGYFLSVAHPELPSEPQTLSYPDVVGESGEITCGFVAFLGGNELTLECHTWGSIDVPDNFRELPVCVGTPPINAVDLR